MSVHLSLPVNEPCRTTIILCSHVESQRERESARKENREGGEKELERQKTGETVREESGDTMFSLTSSLIRPVSLPNTTRQLDLTVLRLPQSHQDYTFKRSNKHEEGKTPESRHDFKKTELLIAEKQKSQNYKGRENKKST